MRVVIQGQAVTRQRGLIGQIVTVLLLKDPPEREVLNRPDRAAIGHGMTDLVAIATVTNDHGVVFREKIRGTAASPDLPETVIRNSLDQAARVRGRTDLVARATVTNDHAVVLRIGPAVRAAIQGRLAIQPSGQQDHITTGQMKIDLVVIQITAQADQGRKGPGMAVRHAVPMTGQGEREATRGPQAIALVKTGRVAMAIVSQGGRVDIHGQAVILAEGQLDQ